MKRSLSKIIVFGWAFGLSLAWAEDDRKPAQEKVSPTASNCSVTLGQLGALGISLIPATHPDSHFHFLAEGAAETTRVARDLGYATPPHLIEFVPGGQLMGLATLGRHALGSWIDGMKLAHQAYSAAGVMEFVTPGCPTCISFYNASTKPNQQLNIIHHVAGHNDYSEHSIYAQSRKADPIRKSLELFDYLEGLYQKYDHDEVSQWIQFLFSFEHLQDLARNTFDEPARFDRSRLPGVSELPDRIVHANERYGTEGSNPYASNKHPGAPTPSVLQFMVRNLAPHAPEWKRKSLELYEEMVRVIGFYTADKFFNEGWATISMEILAGHSSQSTDSHMFDYMELLQGVAGWASLSNPYWLGREAIRIVRGKFEKEFEDKNRAAFEARTEVQTLEPNEKLRLWAKERDRAFVAYFHEHFMVPFTDYDNFLQSIDAQWIFDKNLFLYRKANWDEIDHSLPQPIGRDGRPLPFEQKVIVSTDAERIRYELAKKILDWRFKTPRILVDDHSAFGRGVFSLKHEMVKDVSWAVHGMPLKLRPTAQVLYLMARVMDKAVSLETVHVKVEEQASDINPRPRWFWPPWDEPQQALKSRKIRVEVNQVGQVKVYVQPGSEILDRRDSSENGEAGAKPASSNSPRRERLIGHSEYPLPDLVAETEWKVETEVLDPELTKTLQESVDAYIDDSGVSVNSKLSDAEQKYFMPAISQFLSQKLNGQFGLLSHAPTASRAIAEYQSMIQKRIREMMRRALEGKIKSKKTSAGLRFRVMPLVPQIEFDDGMVQVIQKKVPALSSEEASLRSGLEKLREAKDLPSQLAAERELQPLVAQLRARVDGEQRVREFFRAQQEVKSENPRARSAAEQRLQAAAPLVNAENILGVEVDTMNGKEQIGSDQRRRKKGDKVWGPSDDEGRGNGRKGNDDGEKDGEEPSDGKEPGDGGKDPSEIEVPIELVSAFLEEYIELPRLKPKAGLTDLTEPTREGSVRKPFGDRIYSKMFPNILALGAMSYRKQGIDPATKERTEIVREGMKFVMPSTYVVKDRDETQVPDINAFVLIAIDMSGSMWGWPIETSKKFMFNLKAALRKKYKNIKIGYTCLDGKTKIYYDEDEFFKAWYGGGTEYAEGLQQSKEEFAKYNPGQWDRYFVGIGDSATGDAGRAVDLYKEILDQIEYGAYLHVQTPWNYGDFQSQIQKLLEGHPFGGYAELDPDPGADLRALKKLFGKNKQK